MSEKMAYFSPASSPETSFQGYISASELSLHDVEAVRLILRGDSIVDWHRLNFETREQVDNFLRVNLFEPDSQEDLTRLRYLHQEAVQYLRNHFNLHFPEKLLFPKDVQELILHASYPELHFNRYRLLACIILKVMCILHHIEARSLLYRTPISDMDLFSSVQDRMDAFSEAAQRADVPLIHVYGSRKSRDSLMTKLLSKRETLAATVFDKLRYRIVVERHKDLLPVLAYMARTFLPFNYTIPNASSNNLLSIDAHLADRIDLRERMDSKLSNYPVHVSPPANEPVNVFSGSTYRTISFIVDMPVRLDSFLRREEIFRFGRIAFVMVEFQLVDQGTEDSNEQGENSHEQYKRRQRNRVLERLRRGAFQGLKKRGENQG